MTPLSEVRKEARRLLSGQLGYILVQGLLR